MTFVLFVVNLCHSFFGFLFPFSLLTQVPCRSSVYFQPVDFLGDGRLEETGAPFEWSHFKTIPALI